MTTATKHTYVDFSEFAADFVGQIQWDKSGVGHCWVTEDPNDVPTEVYEGLADDRGIIHDGATCTVSGQHYRAIA